VSTGVSVGTTVLPKAAVNGSTWPVGVTIPDVNGVPSGTLFGSARQVKFGGRGEARTHIGHQDHTGVTARDSFQSLRPAHALALSVPAPF
jgi:hypothetical protein